MLIQGDASALEIRCVAFLAQDKVLTDEIINGVDTHRANQITFKLPGWDVDDKSDEQYKLGRLLAKVLVFRIIYGANEYSFANDPSFTVVSKSKDYWKEVINAYYNKYQGVKKWHETIIREVVNSGGYLTNPNGRFFKFQRFDGKYPETQIKNYPVQALGADIMALARVSFYNRLKKLNFKDCLLVNTVHDSIVVDCDEKTTDVDKVIMTMHEVFDDLPANFKKMFGVEFNVPMAAEVQIGYNWEEMTVVDRIK